MIKPLFYIGFILSAILNIAEAQSCAGSWALQRPAGDGCVTGQWVGQVSGNPLGCPINPTYTALQTNTFTFIEPVSIFSIDFSGFDGGTQCARMEIKVNGVFYPLTSANLSDIPSGSNCTGFFSTIVVTPDGYLTLANTLYSQGRITISNVNATSVTVSTNDGNGTVFSNPFNCTTVPLKLESFTGKSNNCRTLLNWKTGTESNIKNIEIQTSENGVLFSKVGEVSPKGSNNLYSFTTIDSKSSYFRLKFNDLDGYYEYSNILNIKSNCSNIAYQVLPNPASNSIEITGLEKDDKVFIFDMLGKKVLTFNLSLNNNNFDIQILASGMYVLQIINGGMVKSNIKLLKN